MHFRHNKCDTCRVIKLTYTSAQFDHYFKWNIVNFSPWKLDRLDLTMSLYFVYLFLVRVYRIGLVQRLECFLYVFWPIKALSASELIWIILLLPIIQIWFEGFRTFTTWAIDYLFLLECLVFFNMKIDWSDSEKVNKTFCCNSFYVINIRTVIKYHWIFLELVCSVLRFSIYSGWPEIDS